MQLQNKLDQFFTDPQTGKHLQLFADSAIILRPQLIWDLLHFLDDLNEDMRVNK